MLKMNLIKQKRIILAVILMMAMIFTSCSMRKEDDTPPTAPLLTVSSVDKDAVTLAWSESYDDEGIDVYKLYRNDEVLAKVGKTEYKDEDVKSGEEYEYYVVAYDDAGNRSSKSVKQRVKVTDQVAADPKGDPKSALNIQKLSRSTIKLYMLDNDLNIIGMGSGTIIDKEGYILTNYHCVGTNKGLNNDEGYVAIAITDDIKKNIQPQYMAQYRSGVEELDLAVVKIVTDLNWNQVSAKDLNLVPAKISDSDGVELGDVINILGYPGVGGETITFTAGHVSGFLDDNNDDEVDWIKTDAVVNHGNSGGTAVNQSGEMIGVPTAKQVGEDNDVMFYLKPVNQALSIIKNAYAQGDKPNLPEPGTPTPAPSENGVIDVYGRIVDALTMEAIPGAAFVVLKEGVTLEAFVNDPQDSMILAYGEADADGAFVCYDIPKGSAYSVIVGADGYTPIAEDNALDVPADWEDDMDMGDIYLETAQKK